MWSASLDLSAVLWQALNFWVPLVHFVGAVLDVSVICANTDEVDLELEWTVHFVSQSEPNGVNLKTAN